MPYARAGFDLEIDLSRAAIERREGDPTLYDTYLGGRGTCTKLFWDRVPPETEPFSPDNPLIFGVGLLTGTLAPGANRTAIVTKSPQTRLLTFSNLGGFWGPELNMLAMNTLILSGRSPTPVYLWINDGQVEIRDARHLWGRDVRDTQRAIRQELDQGKVQDVCPRIVTQQECSSRCPAGAITHHHYRDEQILAQIDAAYSVPLRGAGPKILAFLCNWCGYAGADLAGVYRIQYAPNVRVIRVMCSARVHADFVLRAFSKGVDVVLVVGCHSEDCHYVSGIQQATRMVGRAQRMLEKAGVDPDRLQLAHISAGKGARFAEMVDCFTADVAELDPLELVSRGGRE